MKRSPWESGKFKDNFKLIRCPTNPYYYDLQRNLKERREVCTQSMSVRETILFKTHMNFSWSTYSQKASVCWSIYKTGTLAETSTAVFKSLPNPRRHCTSTKRSNEFNCWLQEGAAPLFKVFLSTWNEPIVIIKNGYYVTKNKLLKCERL